jgi:uncharacterized membrane protein YuzA (DUF378 family)
MYISYCLKDILHGLIGIFYGIYDILFSDNSNLSGIDYILIGKHDILTGLHSNFDGLKDILGS